MNESDRYWPRGRRGGTTGVTRGGSRTEIEAAGQFDCGAATGLVRRPLFVGGCFFLQQHCPPPTHFRFHFKGLLHGSAVKKSRRTVPTAREGVHTCTQIQKDSFYFLVGSVLFVFDCILTLYYCCLFVCRDGDIFPQ